MDMSYDEIKQEKAAAAQAALYMKKWNQRVSLLAKNELLAQKRPQ